MRTMCVLHHGIKDVKDESSISGGRFFFFSREGIQQTNGA